MKLFDYAGQPDALKDRSLAEREDLALLAVWGLEFLGKLDEQELNSFMDRAWQIRGWVLPAVRRKYVEDMEKLRGANN